MGYLYIFGTIIFTVYGQLVIKWQIQKNGQLPNGMFNTLSFLLKLFLNPYIVSGFIAAFLASLFWMAAMTKFEISFAYPFMSLSFILVLIISAMLLGETITLGKVLGLLLIVAGLIVSVKL